MIMIERHQKEFRGIILVPLSEAFIGQGYFLEWATIPIDLKDAAS